VLRKFHHRLPPGPPDREDILNHGSRPDAA
jgi:hypothetical protein